MDLDIGKLIASLGLDPREFNRAMKQVEGEMHRADQIVQHSTKKWNEHFRDVGMQLHRTGKQLSMFVTLPLIAAAGASFKMASDFNESLNKVDVSFKENAVGVRKWSETTLEAFGIAQGTALDMAAMFGDMGTSMGLTTVEAAKMSTQLVGLAGDLSSFKNISISIAETALAAIFTGETASLKKLGIVMTEANLEMYALSQGMAKNIRDMNQAEKVQLRYNYVVSVTKNSQGDFARTVDQAANQMRIFKESIKEVSANLGQVLIPIITPVIKRINEFLKNMTALSDQQKKNIIIIGAIVAALGPLLSIIAKLLIVIPALKGAFVALSAFMVANPFVLVGLAIVALLPTIDGLIQKVRNSNFEWKKQKDNINEARKALEHYNSAMPAGTGEILSGKESQKTEGIDLAARMKDWKSLNDRQLQELLFDVENFRNKLEDLMMKPAWERVFGQKDIEALNKRIAVFRKALTPPEGEAKVGIKTILPIADVGDIESIVRDSVSALEEYESAMDGVNRRMAERKEGTDFIQWWDDLYGVTERNKRQMETFMGVVHGLEGAFTSFFSNIGKGFDQMLAGFTNMLTQMLAQLAAKAAIFALLSLISGGTGGLAKMATSMMGTGGFKGFIGLAGGGVIPPGYPNDSFPALLSSGEKVISAGKSTMENLRITVDGSILAKDIALALRRT